MITAAALVLSDGFGVDTKMKDISSFWNSSSPMSKDLCKKVKLFVHNLLYCDFDDYYTETTGKNDPPKWMTTGMFYTLLDMTNRGIKIAATNRDYLNECILDSVIETHQDSKDRYAQDVAAAIADGTEQPTVASYPHWMMSNHDSGKSRVGFLEYLVPNLHKSMEEHPYLGIKLFDK